VYGSTRVLYLESNFSLGFPASNSRLSMSPSIYLCVGDIRPIVN
jgi:hypothetical protein